jgi:hypothetical protein
MHLFCHRSARFAGVIHNLSFFEIITFVPGRLPEQWGVGTHGAVPVRIGGRKGNGS